MILSILLTLIATFVAMYIFAIGNAIKVVYSETTGWAIFRLMLVLNVIAILIFFILWAWI